MNEQTAHDLALERQRISELESALAAERTQRFHFEQLLAAHRSLSEAEPDLDLDTLLKRLLAYAEDLTASRVGFFHRFAEDQRTITLHTWSDRTECGPCRAGLVRHQYQGDEAGVWMDCVRTRRPVIHNDFTSLRHRRGFPEGHVPLVRELVAPIFRNTRIVAILGVGNKEEDYTQNDIDQISKLGDLAWDIVLRKDEENRLRISEDRFRRLFHDIPMISIQGYGADGRVRFWNPASEKLYGYLAEEAMGRSLLELIIPPQMRAQVENDIAAMAKSGQPLSPSELTLQRKDGSLVEVFSSHALIQPDGGEPELFCVDIDLGEQKKIEASLAAALREKEVLLKEVHHRVKNNLAAVIGLLDMQAQLPMDPGSLPILRELSGRIRSMALAHEHLYQAKSLARINVHRYLEALLTYLRAAFPSPHVRIEIDAEEIDVPLDLAIPCGLIVNELVTNALKYAFPDGRPRPGHGECLIGLSMVRAGAEYRLSVMDNGVGLPPDFDCNHTRSLGMLLVRMLGEHQLGGRCTFDGSEGTRITLCFTPRKQHAHEESHASDR